VLSMICKETTSAQPLGRDMPISLPPQFAPWRRVFPPRTSSHALQPPNP
jgi:hypothetical protein